MTLRLRPEVPREGGQWEMGVHLGVRLSRRRSWGRQDFVQPAGGPEPHGVARGVREGVTLEVLWSQ